MDKRRMCSNCRAFITTDDKVCPYCDFKQGARAIDLRAPDDLLGGLLPATRFLTTIILILNSGLYVATVVYSMNSGNPHGFLDPDGRVLILFGSKVAQYIGEGQWWRLVTAGFLHGGIIHIAFNSFSLLDVGSHVEETYGMSRMAVIYLVSTVAGFGLSCVWSPFTQSTGASAGVFGLIGAMLAWGMKWERTAYGSAVKSQYSRWLVYGLIISFMPNVDMGAHLGGLAGGFAVGWIAGEPNKSGAADKMWDIAMYLSIAIVLACFAQVARALLRALTEA